MTKPLQDIQRAAIAAGKRLRAWVASPFESLYRWAVPLVLLAALTLALPPVVGIVLYLPVALAFGFKAACVARRIHRLEFVVLVEEDGRTSLDTERDRRERAWVLGCASIVVVSSALLIARTVFALVPAFDLPDSVAIYLGFASVLVGGFLLCYYGALRLDSALLRGLASITVTLPAFFVIVAVMAALLSWIMGVVAAFGPSAEGVLAGGFSWVYDVQRVLGSATGYFVQQDAVVIGGSIVFAALLLLLYAYTVPYYWIASVARWFKGLGLAAVVFSGAAIVFAGAWVADVQRWAVESGSGQLPRSLDADVLGDQAAALAGYRSDDLIALVKAFVLPYTVGVFVANAVVAYRKAKAKRESDAILDGFARTGSIEEDELPEQEKRYLFYGGRRTLWDIALRSIGHDVALPHPFAPRKLTWKERLTGELGDE